MPPVRSKMPGRINKVGAGFGLWALCIRLSADFSKETWQARRGWKEVFEVMKGKNLHPRLLYPAKPSFRMEGKIKCFSDKVKLKEFIITKPLLYEMLNGLI